MEASFRTTFPIKPLLGAPARSMKAELVRLSIPRLTEVNGKANNAWSWDLINDYCIPRHHCHWHGQSAPTARTRFEWRVFPEPVVGHRTPVRPEVVDCCRENLWLVGDSSISGAQVARELDTLVRLYGKSACIVSDSGTEFVSRAPLEWAGKKKVEWHIIDPGKPQQNGFIGPSTARCTTNCSTRSCLRAWPMRAGSWPSSAMITTMSGPTRRWEIGRLHKRVGRSSKTRASLPTRLYTRRGHRV